MSQPVVAASYFDANFEEGAWLALEDEFAPLSSSIIYQLNDIYWRHTDLWESTYNEHFEKSLPAGVSESHRSEFIQQSVHNFMHRMHGVDGDLRILEYGPGTGLYAREFLSNLRSNSPDLFNRVKYYTNDKSVELLTLARANLAEFSDQIEVYTDDDIDFHFIRHGNVWDQMPCRVFTDDGEQTFKAVIGEEMENMVADIRAKGLEKSILDDPESWKPLILNLKLQTSTDSASLPDQTAKDLLSKHPEVVVPVVALEHMNKSLDLLNSDRGYLEIVDVFTSDPSELIRDRRPKKFDGSLGAPVNSLYLSNWLQSNRPEFICSIKAIRQLNKVLTIERKRSA